MGEIALGSHITLELERQGIIYTMTSKVFNTAETEIIIAPPQLEGNSFKLLERDKIVVLAKIDAYLFRWVCEEWKPVTEGIVSAVSLICTTEGERYNRRNAFRIPIGIEVQATKTDSDKTFKISIQNISYLGVGFSSNEELNIRDKVEFIIIDEGWHFPLTVSIVRKEQPKVNGGKKFYGTAILVSNRDLSKYIARKQLEMVRKSRII